MNLKNYNSFLKTLNLLFYGLLIVVGIIFLLMIASLMGVLISSPNKIYNLINKGQLFTSLQIYGLELHFNEKVVNNFIYDQKIIYTLLLIGILYSIVIFTIIFFTRKLVKSIVCKDIFTITNSKRISLISYGFIFLSLTLHSMESYLFYAFSKLFQLNSFLENTDWVDSTTYHVFGIQWSLLLAGIIIWTISKVFKYGCFLQEEYDNTI